MVGCSADPRFEYAALGKHHAAGGVFLLLYAVGIPATFAGLLWSQGARQQDIDITMGNAPLYQPAAARRDALRRAVHAVPPLVLVVRNLELARKLVLICLLGVLPISMQARAVVGLLVSLTSLLLSTLVALPRSANALQIVAQLSTLPS